MGIEFRLNEEEKTILIMAVGDISSYEMKEMRQRTVELLNETGLENYVVDLSALTSVVEHDTLTTYELGKLFQEIDFPLSAKTAVVLPLDEDVRQQVKFLHTVEVNRMRGPLKYVSSYEEALAWFNS